MIVEKLISGFSWLLVGGFTASWIAIMLSVAIAAALPILSFATTIVAALVVYSVKSAVEGRNIPEDDGLILF